MRSYLIPRDVRGETRILYFFSPKSFMFTVVGILFGAVLYFIFKTIGLQLTGVIILFVVSLISFAIGALKIPETNAFQFFKDTGGESIDDIIWRYINFNMKKCIYITKKQ